MPRSRIVQVLNTPLSAWLMDAKWSEAAADVLRCLEGLHGHDDDGNSALISAVLSLTCGLIGLAACIGMT